MGVVPTDTRAPDPARPGDGVSPTNRAAVDRAAIAIPTVLAGVLCLVGLTSRSLGFDEAASVTIASQHGSALGSAIAHDGGNMSGYYLLLHLLIGAFGNGLVVIRGASVLASIATVALVGAVGLRLFDRRAALAAGLLAAVSQPLVFWAQNARGYALMVAFVCAAFLALTILVQADQRAASTAAAAGVVTGSAAVPGVGGPSRRHWLAYVVFMTLAVYSSFVAVLVIPAQLVALIRRRRVAARFGLALAAIAVLCSPLIVLALRRGSSQLFWVPRPTGRIELQVLQSLTSAGLQPSFHRTPTTTILLILTVLLLLLVVGSVVLRCTLGGRACWGELMTAAWFAVPVGLAWLASYVIQPLFLPRNLLMSVPPVALLLGAGIADRRLPRRVALLTLLALVTLRALQASASYGVSPEPWRQASAYVLANARTGDCLAFYPADGRMAFQYYVGSRPASARRAPRSILPSLGWGQAQPFVEDYATLSGAQIAQRGQNCSRLWFVSSHEGQLDGPPRSLANHARFLQLRAQLERAFGAGPVKRFGYASPVHVQLLSAGPAVAGRRQRRSGQGRSVVP